MKESELRRALTQSMSRSVFPDSGKQEILDRMNGGKPVMKRKLSLGLVCAMVLVLLTCTAVAATLLNRNVLEEMVGNVTETAEQYIQRDLAKVSFEHCDVEIKEAAYDGMSLYILYGIRDRSATESWETLDEATRSAYLNEESFPAMKADKIGWWRDGIWINGKAIDMPQGSTMHASFSEQPGEMLFYQMYRLDQEGIFLKGNAVEIGLSIGEAHSDEHGMVTFTLNADSGLNHTLTEYPKTNATVTDKVTAAVAQVNYTPLQTYITLSLKVNEDAMAAFIKENGEGPVDDKGQVIFPYSGMHVYGGWVESLKLVDENGVELFPGEIGCNGFSDQASEFVYPSMKTIPEKMFLAPVTNGQADMTQAISVR